MLGDPGSKFICGKLENTGRKKKEHTRKKRDGVRTDELNRRDQVTATKSWPSFLRKKGTEVDYQVAAPNESSTPKLHRATIAQQRVRMEGWRQERLGSRAGTHREEEKNKNILTEKEKKKNILDTHRPSHGRTLPRPEPQHDQTESVVRKRAVAHSGIFV